MRSPIQSQGFLNQVPTLARERLNAPSNLYDNLEVLPQSGAHRSWARVFRGIYSRVSGLSFLRPFEKELTNRFRALVGSSCWDPEYLGSVSCPSNMSKGTLHCYQVAGTEVLRLP